MTGFIPISEGVFKKENSYYTINLAPGESVYGEDLVEEEDVEYRRWDPSRSKLGAFLKREGGLPLKHDMDVLYLGAGSGTTVSHVSDILTHGKIYAVEVAREPYRSLLSLSKKRKNIFPIKADAAEPESYEDIVGKVDLLYQDIAQRDQLEIFKKNLRFLKDDHYGFFAVKSRSIAVETSPDKIYDEIERGLSKIDIEVVKRVDISRWQKDHAVIVVRP